MHILKISAEENEKFLAQEPHDPVTGDRLLDGDEIVICASCGTAFLRESWLYIGGQHCGQSQTLDHIPLRKGEMRLFGKIREKIREAKILKPVSITRRMSGILVDLTIASLLTVFGSPLLAAVLWLFKDVLGQSLGKNIFGLTVAGNDDKLSESSFLSRIFRNLPTAMPFLTLAAPQLLDDWGSNVLLNAVIIFAMGFVSLISFALEGFAVLNGENRITDILLGTTVADKEEFQKKLAEWNKLQNVLTEETREAE